MPLFHIQGDPSDNTYSFDANPNPSIYEEVTPTDGDATPSTKSDTSNKE